MSGSKLNLQLSAPWQIKEGVYRSYVNTDNLMMAIIDFTNGPWDDREPYHSHPHEQVSYVAKGEIIFYCEDRQEQHLKEGDTFAVPSGKEHSVKVLTEHVRLIDSFTPIREDFLK
jgi:quercetin dioxygenase-like cupin family protein